MSSSQFALIYNTKGTLAVGSAATPQPPTTGTSGSFLIPNIKSLVVTEVQGDDGKGAEPSFVLNQTTPNGMIPPHKSVEGTLTVASEAWIPFFSTLNGGPYIVMNGDNKQIPYFIATQPTNLTNSGTPVVMTYTFTGVFMGKTYHTYDSQTGKTLTNYDFKAYYYVPSRSDGAF